MAKKPPVKDSRDKSTVITAIALLLHAIYPFARLAVGILFPDLQLPDTDTKTKSERSISEE